MGKFYNKIMKLINGAKLEDLSIRHLIYIANDINKKFKKNKIKLEDPQASEILAKINEELRMDELTVTQIIHLITFSVEKLKALEEEEKKRKTATKMKMYQTLKEYFGDRYEKFIEYLNSQDKSTIDIFKKRYGENFDTYIKEASLTPTENSRIYYVKLLFHKNKPNEINPSSLQARLGEKCAAFIEFLKSQDKNTVDIFKKRYGENLNTYFRKTDLTPVEIKKIHRIIEKFLKNRIKRNRSQQTLKEYFREKHAEFIEYLKDKDKYTITLYKKRYGENLDTYNIECDLTEEEIHKIRRMNYYFKTRKLVEKEKKDVSVKVKKKEKTAVSEKKEKEITPTKSAEKKPKSSMPAESTKPAEKKTADEKLKVEVRLTFEQKVFKITGKTLEEIFPGKTLIVKFLLKSVVTDQLKGKTIQEILDLLNKMINKFEGHKGRVFENLPLYSELERLGFNNMGLNVSTIKAMPPNIMSMIY